MHPRPPSRGIIVSAGLDPRIRCFSAQEPRTEQTKNFRKYLSKALYCHQKGVLLPCYQPIKHMTLNKSTISLSASRSYASLARAVHTINDNLYKDELFAEDRIVLKDFYAKDGSLTHFEITGAPLDLFMVGTRYGAYEEAKRPRLAYRELADMVESIANDVPQK